METESEGTNEALAAPFGVTSDDLNGINVVVKFYLNTKSEKKNLLTRTLGKVGLIKREWYEQNKLELQPRHKEFWRVKVAQETFSGQNKGCFFVEPLERILPIDIIKLVSGMYEEEEKNGILFIRPFRGDLPFILPLIFKRSLSANKNYATIVPLSPEEFTKI